MPVERREQAIRVMVMLVNWQQEEPNGCGGGRQLLLNGTSRVTGDGHARICEGLGVTVPGATRPGVGQGRACYREAKAFSFTHHKQGDCGRHGTEEWCVTSGGLAESSVALEEVTL
jgi:hypothetical protein